MMDDTINPEDELKMAASEWAEEKLKGLNEQLDAYDVEIEVQKKKGKKGKDTSQIQTYRERHKFHVQKLEAFLRLLSNDHDLDKDEFECLQDCVDYYMTEHDTENFYFDDTCYDGIVDENALPAAALEEHELLPEGDAEQRKIREAEEKKKKAEEAKAKEKAKKESLKKKELEELAKQKELAEADPEIPNITEEQLLQEAPEFVCKICLNIVDCGSLTKCSHLFCDACMSQWFDAQPKNVGWAHVAKISDPKGARVVPCP